jgi:hypothetical protein
MKHSMFLENTKVLQTTAEKENKEIENFESFVFSSRNGCRIRRLALS